VMRFTILKYGALPANFSGKAKTMMQSIGITFCLMPFELMWPPAWWIGITLIAIALVLTLWSGLRNVNDGLRLRREALAQKAA
ncbi:MAG: CDP-diacylglycerol--glycerol-3-phosphate 3-phosphatidyltransferase, partial [Dermabacter sp.]|nr:CDP-diacylglycerol--glycerol-3-phosphate 3-phosphatidyltransferase [Dermabacter sp.]